VNSTDEEKLKIKSQLNELELKLGLIDDELDYKKSSDTDNQNEELLRVMIETSKMKLKFLKEDIPSIKNSEKMV
jgi:hypothetical protein